MDFLEKIKKTHKEKPSSYEEKRKGGRYEKRQESGHYEVWTRNADLFFDGFWTAVMLTKDIHGTRRHGGGEKHLKTEEEEV